jgi:lysophospholipase L1-like esterase
MTRFRGRLPVALLVAFGAMAGSILLETGARVAAVLEERRQGRLDRDLAPSRRPAPGSSVSLGGIIAKSANPRIVYELLPRLDVRFAGKRLTTSDGGYRGAEVKTPKDPLTYRIVGIGDSYMFGQGVSDDETYLSLLPALMNGAIPGRTIETLNLAVPGYNTVMEVETLRERAAALEPDLVLIEIVGNDLDLPNFLWNSVDPWTLRRSFLLDLVRKRLASTGRAAATPELSEAPLEEGGPRETFSHAADRVPRRYASMVGPEAFDQAIKQLGDLSRDRHIRVLALTHGVWFEDAMLKTLAENGIRVLVLRSALRQRARASGAPDYPRSPLALSPADLHPSTLGHRAIAEELAAWLKRQLDE